MTIITLGAFRTNAVATGMVKLPPHPAYANSASAASRRAILTSLKGEMDPAYQVNGDTAKAAGALYRLTELPSPPVRICLNCVEMARQKIASFSKELEEYASWSEGLDLD